MICLGFGLSTQAANNNPFKRAQEQAKAKYEAKKSIPDIAAKLKMNLIMVPTTEKTSWWDTMTDSWETSQTKKYTYQNNRITDILILTYDLNDTLGRTLVTYDSEGRYSLVIDEMYDMMTGTYVPYSRVTFEYQNNGLTTIQTHENYNNQWEPQYRSTSALNSRGETIKEIYESYQNGQWTLLYGYASYIQYLNNTPKIVERVDSSYSFTENKLIADYRELRSFDANEQMIDIAYFENENNTWELQERDSIFFDAGIPVRLIMYENDGMGNLERTAKIDNINWGGVYNPNSDLFENEPIYYEYSAWVNMIWELTGRESTSFPDAFGSRIHLYEMYEMNTWIPDYRYSVLFDSHLNFIEESEEMYDQGNSGWDTYWGYKNNYQYDGNDNPSQLITQSYNQVENVYENGQRYEYSDYISIQAGIAFNKNLEATLYPNPSEDGKVFISFDNMQSQSLTIQVYNLNGQLIHEQANDLNIGQNEISFSGLNSGMYIVRILSEEGIANKKLIVR